MKTNIFLCLLFIFLSGQLVAQKTSTGNVPNKEIYMPEMTKEQKAEEIKQKRIKQAEIKKSEVVKTEISTVNSKEVSVVNKSDTTKTSQPSNSSVQMQTHKQNSISIGIEKVKIDESRKSENN